MVCRVPCAVCRVPCACACAVCVCARVSGWTPAAYLLLRGPRGRIVHSTSCVYSLVLRGAIKRRYADLVYTVVLHCGGVRCGVYRQTSAVVRGTFETV